MSTDYRHFQFGTKVMDATDEQYSVITADINKNILVLACAGSGKSTTMICRVKYLIEHGIEPRRIMLTTFNVDACESLRQKLKQLFDDNIPDIFIGTLDSISCRMYNKYCKQDHFVGVSEYAIYFQKFLESPNGSKVTKQFDVVIFDEFQDINELQYKIIKTFYDNHVAVTLIGDDAQNIYQWRGSDVKYILNASTYFPNIQKYYLSLNYRSSSEVVDFASAIIKNNKDQIVKPMHSHMGITKIMPIIQHFYSLNQQSKDIIRDISILLRSNVKPDDIAIISRNNFPIKNIEEELAKNNKSSLTQIRFVSLITDNNSDIKPKITEGCVTLTTIHKAKGLEWNYVYFASCDDETIPCNLDEVGIQEERRLFYVASTRAKRFLKLSFTRKTVSRFVAEINPKLCTFIRFMPEYFRYSNRRSHLPPSDLDKLVGLIQENDIETMRQTDILPPLKPMTTKIHDAHKYDAIIDDNYLHSDFNNFVSRFIVRSIGTLQKNETCFTDIYANSLSNSITVSRESYNSYIKYAGQIYAILPKLTSLSTDYEILQLLGDVANEDIGNVINIIHRMIAVRDATCGKVEPMVVPKNYIPVEFMQQLSEHYEKYRKMHDVNVSELLQYIYTISLCENICDSRRRLMYTNVYKTFLDTAKDIFDDITTQYIPTIVENKLKCHTITRSEFGINTLIKIYDTEAKKLTDIHLSTDSSCKLEWIIESLGQVAILREKNMLVEQFDIYNPMQGNVYCFDVSKWNKGKELLQKLDEIRTQRENRNQVKKDEKTITLTNSSQILSLPMNDALFDDVNIINAMITMNPPQEMTQNTQVIIPIKEQPDQSAKLINEIGDLLSQLETIYNRMSGIIENIDKINDEMEVCNMEANALLEMKQNRNNKPYYAVFDTETTGLPARHASPEEPNMLHAYDKARLLQISWAIYDENGKLLKIKDHLIKPVGYKVDATHIHGITEAIASRGHDMTEVLREFFKDIQYIEFLIGHNISFDVNILRSELIRLNQRGLLTLLNQKHHICTKMDVKYDKPQEGGRVKRRQCEIYETLFGKKMVGAHNSKFDTLNLGRIVIELRKRGKLVF